MSRVHELLTSRLIDGRWHAGYPTAQRTLCGLEMPARVKGRKWVPTCTSCLEVAKVFNAIDGSCPPFWQIKVTVAERRAEEQLAA